LQSGSGAAGEEGWAGGKNWGPWVKS